MEVTVSRVGGGGDCKGGEFARGGKGTRQALPKAFLYHFLRVPNTSELGTKSEVAHMWTIWLDNSCCLGGPQCFKRGTNQKWPTCGRINYITLAIWAVPNAAEWRTKSEVAHKWAYRLHHSCRLGGSPVLQSGGKNQK